MLAPICLFTYNRLSETQQTIEALKNNFLASESELFIFSDGAKNESSKLKVDEVRKHVRSVSGFKSVSVIESDKNKGLARSIISGVSEVIEKFGKVIVVEDDLITSRNFLQFMNESLSRFQKVDQIFSVSGFSVRINVPVNYPYDAYFWGRAHSWGWATWLDRWKTIDWEFSDFDSFKSDKQRQKEFNRYGSDLTKMLVSAQTGKVDSWYVRFTYNQFLQKRLTVYPVLSKVINNGFMEGATHTNSYNRIKIEFDKGDKIDFKYPDNIEMSEAISKQVYKYKSLSFRAVGKILTYLMRFGFISQRKTTI
jgi:glycosyl transferase family 2